MVIYNTLKPQNLGAAQSMGYILSSHNPALKAWASCTVTAIRSAWDSWRGWSVVSVEDGSRSSGGGTAQEEEAKAGRHTLLSPV